MSIERWPTLIKYVCKYSSAIIWLINFFQPFNLTAMIIYSKMLLKNYSALDVDE